jgi:hypothetical protein
MSVMKQAARRWWLVAFVVFLAAQILWLFYSQRFYPTQDPSWLTGFRGNTISGIIAGFMFLFLTLFLSAGIEAIQRETNLLIRRQTDEEEDTQKIQQFKQFLRTESYHDVCFPQIKTPQYGLGLQYTIEPVREADGTPRQLRTEMEVFDIVKVRSIANRNVLTVEERREYEAAPIYTGEYYFCRYYNRAWHMGKMNTLVNWHEFYLSSKVGPVVHGFSANYFVGADARPPKSRLLGKFIVKDDGTQLEGEGGGNLVEIFKTEDGEVFLQINRSPPKSLYIEEDLYGQAKGPVIENLEGYFPGPARVRLIEMVLRELRELGEHLRTKISSEDA